jgi:XapX domain-containing protein
MKLIIGLVMSFAVGVFCRVFDIPVGSPPVIPGALLVLAMTLGYTSANSYLNRRNKPATTSHLCGGPSGATIAQAGLSSSVGSGASQSGTGER